MKRITLLALAVLFSNLLAYSQTATKDPSTNIQNDWLSINENAYSIQYPGDWELNKSGQMGTSFLLLSKQISAEDQFRENVNLIIQDLAGQNIDLNKYVEISEGQIKTMMKDGTLLESKRLGAKGAEFHHVIFTGDQGIYKLKFEQYYWIKDAKAYVLTLTCETHQFDAYKEIGEKILKSFILK